MNFTSAIGALGAFAACAVASAQFLGPTPYLSGADSPFVGAGLDYFYLEDFEDSAVNTPGLSAVAGQVAAPGPLIDSVDGDDGVIDGSGTGGHSFYSMGTLSSFEFRFDAGVLGTFPTHAGVVWTDVGIVLTGDAGFGGVLVEPFDAAGVSLGVFGPFQMGDGVVTGGTAEDRFVGYVNAGGISALRISMDNSVDWEVDHVQYGYIPAPGAGLMLVLGGIAAVRRRR